MKSAISQKQMREEFEDIEIPDHFLDKVKRYRLYEDITHKLRQEARAYRARAE